MKRIFSLHFASDRLLLWSLCAVAAVRVFLYAAAFPFFGNVDEGAHIDMVIRYSDGEFNRPVRDGHLQKTAEYFAVYLSPEYLVPADTIAVKGLPPPRWKRGDHKLNEWDSLMIRNVRAIPNNEATQPPLYYALAAPWYKTGEAMFDNGLKRLYWLRFMNVIFAALFVWIVYLCAREMFAGDRLKIFSATALAALIPQDAFYSVQSDVLSPVCYGAAFLFCIRFVLEPKPSARQAALLGLFTAATGLVKVSNLPLIAIVGITVMLRIWRLRKDIPGRQLLRVFVSFIVTAAIPLVLWALWMKSNYGDFNGTAAKMQALTWTWKPVSEWLDNGIFTPAGFGTFWYSLLTTLWRGEFIFNTAVLAMPAADMFYVASSVMFPIACLFTRAGKRSRTIKRFALLSLMSTVIFLVVISLPFDYGNCGYPSRAEPYFRSGRLISGALAPFILLYVCGFYFAFSFLKRKYAALGFAALLIAITVSEAVISRSVFTSPYNFLHL